MTWFATSSVFCDNIMSTTQVYIMLGQKIKYHLWFRKMTSLQHYRWSTIKLVLHVCNSIFPNNWKFLKLCKIPLSNISFCNSYGFQCFLFVTYIPIQSWTCVICKRCSWSWKFWNFDMKNKKLWSKIILVKLVH